MNYKMIIDEAACSLSAVVVKACRHQTARGLYCIRQTRHESKTASALPTLMVADWSIIIDQWSITIDQLANIRDGKAEAVFDS